MVVAAYFQRLRFHRFVSWTAFPNLGTALQGFRISGRRESNSPTWVVSLPSSVIWDGKEAARYRQLLRDGKMSTERNSRDQRGGLITVTVTVDWLVDVANDR